MKGLPLKPFYFLRHGETDWNLEHRAMGSQDIPLNDRGVSQGLNAAELLKNEPIATIVSSPLPRARKTADIIAQHIKAHVIEITELQEACWGEKEGQLKGKGLWINGWRNGEDIKGAEGYADFSSRIKRGLEKALEHKGPVLIVSHGGVYWVVQEILGSVNISKERHLIECFFGKIKHFRRVVSRFDKTAESFMGFLHFVASLIWLR